MPQFNKVILVDSQDNEIGTKDKLQAHLDGDLHRAFSIFVFNNKNELLLQKRASSKYHSPNLWTNTCCSHPQPGVTMNENLQNRLMVEMGFQCQLAHWFSFTYKISFENGLTEHEFDHVYKGTFNGIPNINPDEVAEYKYINLSDLKIDIQENPQNYSAWLRLIINKIVA